MIFFFFFVWGQSPFFLNIMMHVFCVFKKKYFPFVGLTWQFQSVQLLCLPVSVLLYCYFEVFDRLAAFAYQLSIFVVLYICAVL